MGSDYLGIQRALGSIMFTNCELIPQVYDVRFQFNNVFKVWQFLYGLMKTIISF